MTRGNVNIHEYQAKEFLKKYAIPIPPFETACSLIEIEEALSKHGWQKVVLKAQVHVGGRGKAGGVKVAESLSSVLEESAHLLQKKLINQQTGPEGIEIKKLLISPYIDISQEFYIGITINRSLARPVLIASASGGIDIEETAEGNERQILTLPLPIDGILKTYHFLRIAKHMGWKKDVAIQGQKIIASLIQAFRDADATLLEINPLILTEDQKLLAIDAKLTIDDNAVFRQPEMQKYFDPTQLSPLEARAKTLDLAYIPLKGNIGCMVNGAGLAMATMDLLSKRGGLPANFLDIGGGASEEKIAQGLHIILEDPQVKVILINVFGGIMNCQIVAQALCFAQSHLNTAIPFVIRLQGNHKEEGKKILASHSSTFIIVDELKEAVEKAIFLAN